MPVVALVKVVEELDIKLLREVFFHLVDLVQFVQKPLVNVRHLPYLLNGISTVECGRDSKYPLVSRIDELVIDILDKFVLHQWVSKDPLELLTGLPWRIR